MNKQPTSIWQEWRESLIGMQMNDFVAAFLEATAPLALVGAQLVYFGQPILRGLVAENKLTALVNLLEDREAMDLFIHDLREVKA